MLTKPEVRPSIKRSGLIKKTPQTCQACGVFYSADHCGSLPVGCFMIDIVKGRGSGHNMLLLFARLVRFHIGNVVADGACV